MRGMFDLESNFMQLLSSIADLVIVNVLFIICSIPLFTMGAAFSAMHYVLLKMVNQEDSHIIRTFFEAFRQNFKRATPPWLVFFVISAVIAADVEFMIRGEVTIPQISLIVFGVLYALMFMVMIYALPMISRYENSTKQILKNSLFIGMLNLPKSIGMVLMYVAPIVLWYFSGKTIIFLLLLGFSGPAYCNSRVLKELYEKYEQKEESEANET